MCFDGIVIGRGHRPEVGSREAAYLTNWTVGPTLIKGDAMKRLYLAIAIAAVLLPVSLHGQGSGNSGSQPDLSGFWINQYTPNLAQALGKEPPFTAFGAERWRTVDTSKDPTGVCLPPGPSRAFTAPFPFLLIQHKDMVGLLYEYQTIWRVIYTDGRPHPQDIADYPHFMGASVG